MTEGARTYRGPWDPERHGTLAEEAVRLAEAAQTWLGSRGAPGGDAWAHATDDVDGPAECRTCPICRARRFARSLDPEVRAHLADAVGSLGAAVAAFGRNRQEQRRGSGAR